MNTLELHLKKKWDDEIQKIGVFKCFEDVFHKEYENLESWLKLYFKDLAFEDKCQIIARAGWNVSTKLKGLVENHELVSFNLYSWILTHDINELICRFSSENADAMQRMNESNALRDGRIQWLTDEVENLRKEIEQLKIENENLKTLTK